jgi:hypothetical protein
VRNGGVRSGGVRNGGVWNGGVRCEWRREVRVWWCEVRMQIGREQKERICASKRAQ